MTLIRALPLRTPGVARLGALVLAVFIGVELITYQQARTLLKRHQDLVRGSTTSSSLPVFSQQLTNESQAFLNQHLLQAVGASLLLLLVFRLTIVRQERELDRLRELERRAYELTENMPAGTYVLTLSPRGDGEVDLNFRFASTRFLEIFGVNRAAVFRDPHVVLDAIHPDDLASMNAANAHAFASGEPFRWEGRLRVDGSTR